VDLVTQGLALLFAWAVVFFVWRFNLTLTTSYRPWVVYLSLGLLSLLFFGQLFSRLVRGGG
jgi:hypothetical protein